MIIIACDYHPSFQQIVYVNTETDSAFLGPDISSLARFVRRSDRLSNPPPPDTLRAAIPHHAFDVDS
jgi:hypothetical protein